ncbi:MAG: hypothetical protein WCA35_20105 [Kovacikia sp.]
MNNPFNSRQLVALVALSAAFMLGSCAKKEDQAAMAPSATPSSAMAPASPSASPSVAATSSPMVMASPGAKTALSAEAQKLGVKPETETTCPTNAPVKGNVTKKRGDLYFTAKFPDYKAVKPEICFKDTETAEKAGFRAPKAQ